MRHVERSALVPFTAEAMFDLVADVESYPDFLPGCRAATVHSRDGDQVVASIALAEGPLRAEFRTRNRLSRPDSITMRLVEGPFSALEGTWTFSPLGTDGSRVSLALEFEFASGVVDALMGPVFASLCNRLVDAFVQRARAAPG